jgi:ribonucleotide reductase beta subunit family protein with ferritin-like domain
MDAEKLAENPERFVLRLQHETPTWKMYKKASASFWVAEEVDMTQDIKDWATLDKNDQFFIKYVHAYFAASDGIVNENLVLNFIRETNDPEARCFWIFQAAMESIHSEVYSNVINTLIRDQAERDELFDAVRKIECIKRKAKWAFKYMDSSTASFAERLVAFAAVEGIYFSGSFCSIFWLKKRGLMPGLCFANSLISRDEGLHCDFACLWYSMLETKLDAETVYAIIREAVEIECQFVSDALPVELIGMNSKAMCEYIQFCADRLVQALGYPKIYKTRNPFDWMDMISIPDKTNFFEKRVGEYAKHNVGTATTVKEFSVDADF